jgi:hypothetical protein
VALIDNAKLHDTLSQLLNENLAATKAKVDAATGSDLIAAARAVMGVPNAGVPATGGAAGADAGGGAAPAAAVHVPSTTSGS